MGNEQAVSGIALDHKISKIGVLKNADQPGIAARLFGTLAAEKSNVDMIVQSVHSKGSLADMAFTVERPELKKAVVKL